VISVNGNSYVYESDYDATELEILNGLKAEIDADLDKTWTATVDSDDLTLTIATTDSNKISILSTSYIGPDKITTSGETEASVNGAIVVAPNTVTEIVSFVSGLDSTTNPLAYNLGRERETDEEFRLRIKTSQQSLGKGTVEAIQDQVSNVPEVTSATVYE